MSNAMIGTLWLLGAIFTDVLSTFYMAKANGVENKIALATGAVLYLLSFVTCVLALKYIQAGILYVLWAGIGAVSTALIAQFFLNQRMDTPAIIGLSCIIFGITVIAQYSNIEI